MHDVEDHNHYHDMKMKMRTQRPISKLGLAVRGQNLTQEKLLETTLAARYCFDFVLALAASGPQTRQRYIDER